MKRTTNYKALYNFVKKQQTKQDRHIVKLDDSLDMIKKEVATPVKTLHNRTQSCPPITEGNHNELKKR